MAFKDRVVMITGAGSGIGRAIALRLSAEGARIAAVDRSPEGLRALADALAGRTLACEIADVTDLNAIRQAAARLETQLGPTDCLIACAGIGKETSALDYKAEDVAAVINVNLIGVSNSVDAVLAGMRQRRGGHLVVLSSVVSYRGLPKMAGYCASKAGVSALFESLRVELEPLGLHVSIICPGWIRTPLTAPMTILQPYMLEVDFAAKKIIEAIRRKQHHFVFPFTAAWPFRLLRWLPSGLSDWLVRRTYEQLNRQAQRAVCVSPNIESLFPCGG